MTRCIEYCATKSTTQSDTTLGRNITIGSKKNNSCPWLLILCVPFNYLLFYYKSLPNWSTSRHIRLAKYSYNLLIERCIFFIDFIQNKSFFQNLQSTLFCIIKWIKKSSKLELSSQARKIVSGKEPRTKQLFPPFNTTNAETQNLMKGSLQLYYFCMLRVTRQTLNTTIYRCVCTGAFF